MNWAGHRDVKTFINHYCFSRYSDEQKRQELEKHLMFSLLKECKKCKHFYGISAYTPTAKIRETRHFYRVPLTN